MEEWEAGFRVSIGVKSSLYPLYFGQAMQASETQLPYL